MTDFLFNVNMSTTDSGHASSIDSEEKRWAYFVAPKYFEYFSKETNSLDYSSLLAKENLLNLEGSEMCFQTMERNSRNKHQLFAQYQVGSESAYMYWNYYGKDSGSTDQGAIVITYLVPENGEYSLQGPLAILSHHQKTIKGAILTIGTFSNSQANPSFTPLLIHTFNQEVLDGEARQIKDLSSEEALQNMQLNAGDEIVFIFGSPRKNHSGMTVIDRDIRIVSDVLPAKKSIDDISLFLSRLDFDNPETLEVKEAMDAGDKDKAFDLYKSKLGERVLKLPKLEKVSYWLHGHANADQLLEGVLSTGHYGAPGTTTYTIGKPGSVDWFKVPEDGYDVILRDITTMHWTNKLAEAYAKTGDRRYLDAYIGYWSDFTTNWYPLFHQKMRDAEFKQLLNGSIQWSLRSRLYIAWRIEVLKQGLKLILHRATEQDTLADLDNAQLAMLLMHLYDREFPAALRFLLGAGGVPNQQAHLAEGMFFFSMFLYDVKGANVWRSSSLDSTLSKGGYLADGTDMEQSFNYNKGLAPALTKYKILAESFLPEDHSPDWLLEITKRIKYRNYFMQSIVMPMSGQPICGKNNTWKEYNKPKKFMPGLEYDLLLSQIINNKFYGDNTAPDPNFRSIYFPYGGYACLRSDWSSDALYAFMKVSRQGRGHMNHENNGIAFSAFGRQMLINSSHNAYSPKKQWKDYGYSSISYNTIAVDGYGQKDRKDIHIPSAYTTTLSNRFLDGNAFSFAEGNYDRDYGGYNFTDPKKEDSVITGVQHKRQLLLLREQKIMIVTDIVESENEHRFTQSWNFPPDYQEKEIHAQDKIIKTNRAEDANVALYQFTDTELEYEKFHGLNEDGRVLGWVGMKDKETGLDMTPAVDIHSSWRGQGKNVLITVIVPYKTLNPVHSIKPSKEGTGFDLVLSGGEKIEYTYGGAEQEASLKTENAQFKLLPGGGYEQDSEGTKKAIIIPNGFKWDDRPESILPIYDH